MTSPAHLPPLDLFLCDEERWCADCGGKRGFLIVEICEAGRIGFCLGCEARQVIPFLPEERVLWPWTRTNSEAA